MGFTLWLLQKTSRFEGFCKKREQILLKIKFDLIRLIWDGFRFGFKSERGFIFETICRVCFLTTTKSDKSLKVWKEFH